MIVLKITNANEVVASKVGRLIAGLTPSSLDVTTVEDMLVKELIVNLRSHGIKGEVAAVKGLDLQGEELRLGAGLQVRHHQPF